MLPEITSSIENASNYASFSHFTKELSDDTILYSHILKIKDDFALTLTEIEHTIAAPNHTF